jgi:hypothetical protein
MIDDRIDRLERLFVWAINRILGDEWPDDIGAIDGVAKLERAAPGQTVAQLDPAALQTIGTALDRFEAERAALAEQIAELSEQVRALAVRELTETAVLLASRASSDPESQRIFEEAAARAGRTPGEHRVASIREYREQTAKIMGAA